MGLHELISRPIARARSGTGPEKRSQGAGSQGLQPAGAIYPA
jgi:hypothetical protein